VDPLVPKIALALAGIAVAAGAGLVSARVLARRQGPASDRLYPYLVPEPYLKHAQGAPEGLFRPLGHGIWVTLVFDLDGAVQGVRSEDLRDLVAGPLGTRDLCASIPHREALLLFPRGDRAHRDAMRALVREKEGDGRKPLTFELFRLGDDGVKPFDEQG